MFDLGPQNLLLQAVLRAKKPHLRGRVGHISFEVGHQFWPAEGRIPFALFPLRGIVSLQVVATPGKQVEIALVGREGFAGVPLFHGIGRSVMSATARSSGEAITMSPSTFQEYLGDSRFRSMVGSYVDSFEVMLAEISLCNRVHGIDKVFVGRLLLVQDRAETAIFQITQSAFSRLIGVRTASISRTAAQLRKIGAIEYNRRGRLTIVDRSRLEKLACSCYRKIKAGFDHLLQNQR